jgi:hypothetical protein
MPPKFEDMWMVVTEQGGTDEAVLDAIDGTIDGIPTAVIFSLQTSVLREKLLENSGKLTMSS